MPTRRSGGTACATPASWRLTRPGSGRCWTRWSSGQPKNEYYLTDVVEHARARGWAVRRRRDAVDRGARRQLAGAARRRRGGAAGAAAAAAMAAGATLIGPETVFLAADTVLDAGRRGRALRGVRAGRARGAGRTHPAVLPSRGGRDRGRRADRAVRPAPARHAEIGDGAKVGNFVEVKNATLEPGAKANHLSLYRRRAGRRQGQHRRRHHHLQLRRLRQAPYRHRRRRVHRLQHGAGGAGDDRRGRRSSAPAARSTATCRPAA